MALSLLGLVAAVLLTGLATTSYFFLDARKQADDARLSADEARTQAKRAAYEAYLSNIRLAQASWEANDIERLGEMVQATTPERTGGEDYRGFEWYYWRRLWQAHCLLTLRSHTYLVRSVAFSPDGRRIASASGDRRVWDSPEDLPLYQAERRRLLDKEQTAWHHQEADDAERSQNGFAALFHLNRLLEATPGDASLLVRRGNVHRQKGNLDQALADFTEVLRREPNTASAHNQRAWVFEDKRDWDRMISEFHEAIRLDPRNERAFNGLGYGHYQRKDYAKALADLGKAIEILPRWALPYQNRALVYEALRDHERAAADRAKVVELEPGDARVHYFLARAQARLGKHDLAIQSLTRAIQFGSRDTTYEVDRGLAYAERKEWDAVVRDFKAVITRNPLGVKPWQCRALVELARDNRPAYVRVCERLAASSGTRPAWPRVLAPEGSGDARRLVFDAEAELWRDRDAKQNTANALRTLGAALCRAGRFEEALARLREAIKASGGEGSALDWLFLAMTEQRLGHTDEAKRWLAKAARHIDDAAKDKTAEPLSWEERTELQLLRREAETLLAAPAKAPDK